MNTISHPNKRVNVVSKVDIFSEGQDGTRELIQKAGIIMRTTRSLAGKLVGAGKHSYTTKSKLRRYLKRTTGSKRIA